MPGGRFDRPLGSLLMIRGMPPEPRVERLDDIVAVTLSGELDAYDAPALRASFHEVVETGPAVIVLDLTDVSFLDSTVLGTIVGLLRRLREGGGELRTVLPETTARRIFEITGLDQALDVRPSRQEALRR